MTPTNPDPIPKMEDRPVPLWIKLMWIGGISWILGYIVLGLSNTPTSW